MPVGYPQRREIAGHRVNHSAKAPNSGFGNDVIGWITKLDGSAPEERVYERNKERALGEVIR
jgi:hypothetical protein